jgi:hypothetical protein
MSLPVYLEPMTVRAVLASPGCITAAVYLGVFGMVRTFRFRLPSALVPPRVLIGIYDAGVVAASIATSALFARAMYVDGAFSHTGTESSFAACRAYNVLKYVELLDTAFIAARGRWDQLSFLHLYHHSSILVLSQLAVQFTPWLSIAPILFMNSIVHIQVSSSIFRIPFFIGCLKLYGYWAILSFQGSDTLPPSWKRRLTQIQMAQFVIGILHSSFGYLWRGFCPYSVLYGLSMLALFSSFYARRYKTNTH